MPGVSSQRQPRLPTALWFWNKNTFWSELEQLFMETTTNSMEESQPTAPGTKRLKISHILGGAVSMDSGLLSPRGPHPGSLRIEMTPVTYTQVDGASAVPTPIKTRKRKQMLSSPSKTLSRKQLSTLLLPRIVESGEICCSDGEIADSRPLEEVNRCFDGEELIDGDMSNAFLVPRISRLATLGRSYQRAADLGPESEDGGDLEGLRAEEIAFLEWQGGSETHARKGKQPLWSSPAHRLTHSPRWSHSEPRNSPFM
jgi:hypothetical protein